MLDALQFSACGYLLCARILNTRRAVAEVAKFRIGCPILSGLLSSSEFARVAETPILESLELANKSSGLIWRAKQASAGSSIAADRWRSVLDQ